MRSQFCIEARNGRVATYKSSDITHTSSLYVVLLFLIDHDVPFLRVYVVCSSYSHILMALISSIHDAGTRNAWGLVTLVWCTEVSGVAQRKGVGFKWQSRSSEITLKRKMW